MKLLFGIFAHPDDEAFGPSGALLMETRSGTELHLITATLGDAGTNPDNEPDLAAVREREWRASGSLIGARTMRHLGQPDGHLDNQRMIEIGHTLIDLIHETLADRSDITEIEFMTFDTNGLTGHIDHIAMARATSWAFGKLKAHDSRVKRIRYFCLPRSAYPTSNTDWVYMDAGRTPEEIDETIDARHLATDITAIVRTYHSQRHDGETFLARQADQLGINHFIVK